MEMFTLCDCDNITISYSPPWTKTNRSRKSHSVNGPLSTIISGASLMMGAIVSHSLIFSLLLRPAPTKIINVLQTHTIVPEDEKTACCQLSTLKEKIVDLLPKFFMFLGWIGIMGGHLFQIAITPIRAGYMGIPDIRGAMLVSILGKMFVRSFLKTIPSHEAFVLTFNGNFLWIG